MKRKLRRMMLVYKIHILRYDMMGYTIDSIEDLSYHHLLVPKRFGGPESFWNGAILNRTTAHDYLHMIEKIEPDMFYAITKELNEEKKAKAIRLENLKRIREVLLEFESVYRYRHTEHGKIIIRDEFIEKRIDLEGGKRI